MTLELTACTYGYSRRKPAVLHDLSYQLPQGLTVLLGPNGAGKSTLLKLAASVTRPRKGSISLDGTPSRTAAYRREVAYMPQDIAPMPSLSAREYVAYVGWLKGMRRNDAWRQARCALARVELADSADMRTTQLSGGQLRRVGVAGALVHGAKVLLLDEPTAGMDPRQRRVFRDLIGTLTNDVQVLLSTHDVVDLPEESDHVTVLDAGRIIYSGSTPGFLAYAPVGTAPGRMAEAAYTMLSERGSHL